MAFALISTAIFFTWMMNPELMSDFEKKYRDKYRKNYENEYRQAVKLEQGDNVDAAIKAFENLLDDYDNINKTSYLYYLKNDARKKIIGLYLKKKDHNNAFLSAKKWMEYDDNDIDAKLYYVHSMSFNKSREEEVRIIYNDLFKKFYNVNKVADAYISYLLTKKDIKNAIRITNEYEKNIKYSFRKKMSFKLYYIDGASKMFTENNATRFNKSLDKINENEYRNYPVILEVDKEFNKIKALRLDFEDINECQTYLVSNIEVMLDTQNKKFKYRVKKPRFKHSMKELPGNIGFIPLGNDPFCLLNLPETLINYSGKMKIRIDFLIQEYKMPASMVSFLRNLKWGIYYGFKKSEFSNQYRKSIKWKVNKNSISSEINFEDIKNVIDKIRIEYPYEYGIVNGKFELNIINENNRKKVLPLTKIDEIDQNKNHSTITYKILGMSKIEVLYYP